MQRGNINIPAATPGNKNLESSILKPLTERNEEKQMPNINNAKPILEMIKRNEGGNSLPELDKRIGLQKAIKRLKTGKNNTRKEVIEIVSNIQKGPGIET